MIQEQYCLAVRLNISMIKKIFICCLLASIFLLGAFLFGIFRDLPSVENIQERVIPSSIRITDNKGRLLYEILPADSGRNFPLPFGQIPKCLVRATLATEDANFYQHPGIDPVGILRALWIDMQGGETLAGGSTITQQVARNLLMSQGERSQPTLLRKLRESILAIEITWRYPKEEILGLYLNFSYYGSLAYGVEAAAQTYFGKPAVDLDLAECALIAGLTQSPASYSPFVDLTAAIQRRSVVLGLMEENSFISQEQRRLAETEKIVLTQNPYPMEAPHFSLLVKAQLDKILSSETIAHGGLVVRTTLNLDWQHLAEAAISNQLKRLSKANGGLGNNVNSAALLALEPTSGAILTMVGSPDYFDNKHAGAINMVLSPRQPGSALKPILYAAALNPASASPWTPATMLLDVSQSFVTHDGKSYTPVNYDQREHGPVLLREALASSLNIPAVLAMQHIGVNKFIQFASNLGLDKFGDPQQYDLSLALGGGEVSLEELTAGYGAFANGGNRVEPFAIWDIRDTNGNIVYSHTLPRAQSVMDSRIAWLISDILSDNAARTLGFGSNSILRLDRPAAVKTGTTSNFHDNWTIGYIPDLVVGVWAGNTDYQPMIDVSGVSGAAPIWAEFMRSAMNNQPEKWFSRPPGLTQLEICANSGALPSPDCPYHKLEWFISGTEPSAQDRLNHKITLDVQTGELATQRTPTNQQISVIALDLPSIAQSWATNNHILLWSSINKPGFQSSAGSPSPLQVIQLLSPATESVYSISTKTPLESQKLRIEAVVNLSSNADQSTFRVSFFVDGQLIAVLTRSPYQVFWQLSPGQHTIWAEVDNNRTTNISEPVTITVNPP